MYKWLDLCVTLVLWIILILMCAWLYALIEAQTYAIAGAVGG